MRNGYGYHDPTTSMAVYNVMHEKKKPARKPRKEYPGGKVFTYSATPVYENHNQDPHARNRR